MNTVSVRDLRQRWPETEKRLAIEGELIVTRDSQPVAKLLSFIAPTPKEKVKRFDFDKHMRWLKRISKHDKPGRPSTDEMLQQDRAERG